MAVEAIQTRLLLLRHGEVDWGKAIDGEPPLSEEGMTAVELAASRLPRFDHIAASPRRPARETAEVIGGFRAVPVWWREDLDEIRTAVPMSDTATYAGWLDRLFESYRNSVDGESLAEGVERMTGALRAIGDRFYGRSTLVVSHPVVLLAFRAQQVQVSVSREHIETLPEMALATVDYLEGRFYVVQDFPTQWKTD